jgi:hypothetical protein
MPTRYLAMTFAGALALAASALTASAETAGTPRNPEGGAGATVGPDAGQAKRDAAMPSYGSKGAAELNAPASGSSTAPRSESAGTITHPGKSFSNPEGGAGPTVGPAAGRAARQKSMRDFPEGASK